MLIKPDEVTLVAALNACSHAGMIEEALKLLSTMKEKFGIEPNALHQTCIVDALGRAGKIEEAYAFAQSMNAPNEIAWTTLLGACRGYRCDLKKYIATK